MKKTVLKENNSCRMQCIAEENLEQEMDSQVEPFLKQVQICGELILEQALEQADGLLRVINAEQALIALGDVGVHALFSSLSVSIRTSA